MAERVTRNRDVPGATVGGRMAGTHTPRARSRSEAATASASAPTTTGMIGEGWPGRPTAAATRATCPASLARRRSPSPDRITPTAARAAAASAGVGAVVKM